MTVKWRTKHCVPWSS